MRDWAKPVIGVLAIIAVAFFLLDGRLTGMAVLDNLKAGQVQVVKDGNTYNLKQDGMTDGEMVLLDDGKITPSGDAYILTTKDQKIIIRDSNFGYIPQPGAVEKDRIMTIGEGGRIDIMAGDQNYITQTNYDLKKGADFNSYQVVQTSEDKKTAILVKTVTAGGYQTDYVTNPFSPDPQNPQTIPSVEVMGDEHVRTTVGKNYMQTVTTNLKTGLSTTETVTATIDSESGVGEYTKTIVTYQDIDGIKVPTMTVAHASSYAELQKAQASDQDPLAVEYNQDQQAKTVERKAQLQELRSELQTQYGITETEISPDGVATYTLTSGSTLNVDTSKTDGTARSIKFTKGTQEFTYAEASSFLNDDTFNIGKKQYVLADTCNEQTPYCLRSGKEIIPLSDSEYNLLDNIDDVAMDATNDMNELIYNQLPPDAQKTMENYWRQIEAKTRGQITSVLSAYIDELLGPFSNGVINGVCSARLYKKETSYENRISGIPVPSSTWETEYEREYYEDIRTAIGYGTVEQLTPDMYRYEITLKLIGDGKYSRWDLYLRNSCDGKDSRDLWSDYGSLGWGEVHQTLYAGQEGDDMVFECSVDPLCKFDQGCIQLNDEGAPRCFALAGQIDNLCH